MHARQSDAVNLHHAGPEIAVASTKAFTRSQVALNLLALFLGRVRSRLDADTARSHARALADIPQLLEAYLENAGLVLPIAERFQNHTDFLFLGRGVNYPVALEGALKLKEISYIHAEGYPAGGMKHGPIALIDAESPCVVLAPRGLMYGKTLSNLEEVRARHAPVIALASDGDTEIAQKASEVIYVPPTEEFLSPLLNIIPLQLLAYHIAVLRGCDVDKPRNLAKSVTVE